MADTPRVTVPVDEQVIKRLQEEADHPGLGDSAMVFGPDLRALLRAYESLSAAPAPEGGAVTHRQASDHAANSDDPLATMLRDVDDRLNRDNPDIPGARVSLHGARLAASYRALAAREEAPAEAGGGVNWKAEYEAVCEARISDRQQSQEIINERDKWIVELIRECDALRAQPPAREDAQPVAWMYAKGELKSLQFTRQELLEREEWGWTEKALYPHPAPDALRVAVSDAMVEAACSRFVSESDDIWSASVWPEGPDDDGDRGDGGRVRLISEADQHNIRAAMRFAMTDALAAREEAPAEAGEGASLTGEAGDIDCTTCQGSGLMRVEIGLHNPEATVETQPCDRCPGLNGARVRLANMARDIDLGLTPLAAWPEQLSNPTSATAKATARDIGLVLSALRAQPQAREDAQPVAWRMIGRDGSTISLQAEPYHGGFAHMMASDVGCTVEPLYTHPAPDALRVAVEALEPFAAISGPVSGLADGIEVRFDASFKLQNRDAMCVTRPMVVTVGDIRRAKNALAALQAEQKGGA